MFREVFYKSTGRDNLGNIREWLDESKYTDKRFGVKTDDSFKIVTGLYEEDEQLINLTLPIYLDGNIIVDLRSEIKKGSVTTDKITDMIISRGIGFHKLQTGVALYLYNNGGLQSIKKQLAKIFANVVANKIGASLSLDGYDKGIITEVFNLFFLQKLYYDLDAKEIYALYKVDTGTPIMEEAEAVNVLHDFQDITDFKKAVSNVGVSARVTRIEEPVLYTMIASITYVTMNKYVIAGVYEPIYMASVIYATMKNPIYKKSYLYNVLKNGSKYFNLDEFLKTLDTAYKNTIG